MRDDCFDAQPADRRPSLGHHSGSRKPGRKLVERHAVEAQRPCGAAPAGQIVGRTARRSNQQNFRQPRQKIGEGLDELGVGMRDEDLVVHRSSPLSL
jgi:hypothetical protein